jgi:primosomal protein N' (replication factor Y)
VPLRPNDAEVRLVVRVPRSDGQRLAAALKVAQSIRSARKESGTVRVRIDPVALT